MLDTSTPFPNSLNMLLTATRNRVMLITHLVCLLSEVAPPTFPLIHLSLFSYLMNSIIHLCIPMFSSCSMFSFCWLCCKLFKWQKRMQQFFLFFWTHWVFVVIFNIESFVLLCFLKLNLCFYYFLLQQVPNQAFFCQPFKYFTEYID